MQYYRKRQEVRSVQAKKELTDLLFKQFNMEEVVRIEGSPDTDGISNKWCDFSSGTTRSTVIKVEKF